MPRFFNEYTGNKDDGNYYCNACGEQIPQCTKHRHVSEERALKEQIRELQQAQLHTGSREVDALFEALSQKRVFTLTVSFEYVREGDRIEFLVPILKKVLRTRGLPWIFNVTYEDYVVDYYKALGVVIQERLPEGAKVLAITFDWCHKKSVVLYTMN